MQHEHTEHVAATPEDVYGLIADMSNLPKFVPQMTAARSKGGGRFAVDARYGGHEQHGEVSFAADDSRRRVEWSAPSGYRGWMQVDPDGEGSRLTLFLDTTHDVEHETDITATLDAIRMLVEARV